MTEFVDKLWNKQYEKLVEFKRKHFHCVVPCKYKEDASLGRWVDNQRHFHSKNIIRLDRKVLLDELGFVWSVAKSAQWNKQYGKLVEFKRKHGNCLVSRKYQEDMSLGKWVDTQRQFHCKNKMRQDRKELLEKIGFVWKVGRSSTTDDSNSSEASISSVGPPNESSIEETEPGQGHVRNRCPSPNRKRPRTRRLADARTNPRDGAAVGSRGSLENDADRDEEDSKPSPLVTSSAPIASYPDQEVVQEEAVPRDGIPSGWTRVKLEPDW